jgi:hypothetical protein
MAEVSEKKRKTALRKDTGVLARLDQAQHLELIRTETVISRLPIHNLVKGSEINIQILHRDGNGKTSLRWEVSPNKRYGHPGQLAYKLDTLVINRILDEIGRPVPRVLKVGSLSMLAREMGANKGFVKKALQQNAGTMITAKLSYKSIDGAERTLEATFNRYNVVFAGEKLPDGNKADSVFVIFSDPFITTLNNAPYRPLSYQYLRQLSPVAQRWYEIVSYKIFPALKYGHARAKMAYSEYCLYSAQTRHTTYRQMRWQMNYVHKAHLASGYLADVEYQEFRDENEEPDWYIYYTPGPLARDHFKSVHKKDWPAFLQPEIPSQRMLKQPQLDFLIEEREEEDSQRKAAQKFIDQMPPEEKQKKVRTIRQGIKARMAHADAWTEETWQETVQALLIKDIIESGVAFAESKS